MGNQCGTKQQSEQGENLLESFRRLLDVANSKNCTNHHIITTLVEECKTLANSNHFSSLLIGTRVGLVFIDVHFGMPVRNFLSTLLD